MKAFQPADIRNIVVVGHGGSGKTTLCESMLFSVGAVARQGRVADGTSTLAHTAEETKRKATVYLSLAQFEANKKKVNLLDAPGYADFIGETLCGLRAGDCALLVVNGQNGVEPDTERMAEILDDEEKPRIVAINMMDKEQAEFDSVMVELNELLNNRAVPLFYPIGAGPDFKGVVNVLEGKGYEFADKELKEIPVPADAAAAAEEAQGKLVELAAESDDTLLEKYLETLELSPEEIVQGLRTGIVKGTLYPVVPVSAEHGLGTVALLSLITDFAPSPLDVPGPKNTDGDRVEISATGHPLAMVFKVTSELMAQKFSFIRSFSGLIEGSADLYNSNESTSERLGQLYNFLGKERSDLEKLVCGDIAAAAKLKSTDLGDTLCMKADGIVLAPIAMPPTNHDIAYTAKNKNDDEKVGTAFAKMREEDPSFHLEVHPDLHQTVLHCMGDQHLDVILERLKRKFNLEVDTAKPKVPFRETIRSSSDVAYRHKKQTGGAGQFADVSMKFEPAARGTGFEFSNEITGGVIPSRFIPAVEKGLHEAMTGGVLAGYPVVDVRARLYFGGYHDVDSSEMAFKIASIQCFKKGMTEASPILLEPVMLVEVRVPDEYMGDVMGDISSRRGKISGMDADGRFQVIRTKVPLAELNRYATSLRS
ncbi:MAG: elongation factor G, partial [Candidatus Eisenbacteria bacterium]|nr:elongation factor G [Candidatus Eisenbacteria bacterium]